MSEHEILSKLLEIMESKLHVSRELLKKENFCIPLTGELFHFTAMDLMYLFTQMEKEFKCKIMAECMEPYEFNTISGILNVMKKQNLMKTE